MASSTGLVFSVRILAMADAHLVPSGSMRRDRACARHARAGTSQWGETGQLEAGAFGSRTNDSQNCQWPQEAGFLPGPEYTGSFRLASSVLS
jgi:hypothetical protein